MSDKRVANVLGRQRAHKKSRHEPGNESDEALDDDADEEGWPIEQKRHRPAVLQLLQMLLKDEADDRHCGKRP